MADRLPFLQRLLLRAGNLALRPLELEIGSNLTLVDSGRGKATLSATGGGGGNVATDTIWDAKGDLAVGTGADTADKLTVGTNGQALVADSAQTTGVKWADVPGTGTVTSVAATVPTGFSVAGSPVTTTGTLAVTLDAQSGNKVLASPSGGGSGTPDFRALLAGDIPAIAESGVTSLVTDLSNKSATTHTTPVMVASGASHAAGHIPDPGASGGTTKYLREDASWAVPPGGSAITIAEVDGAPSGTPGTLKFPNTTLTDNGDGSYTYTAASDSTKAPIASPTFTGITTAPEFSASGLTGATAASRYVGATASGAPVSGTFAVGDWISDQTGKRWTCTVAGTPGTWAQEPGTGGGGSGLYSAYLCYQDQKTSGTHGGSFTSGAWRTRDLNTEVADTGNDGSVASNQITLDAGTYAVRARAPAETVARHQARLQNISDASTILTGTSELVTTAGDQTASVIVGRFTIALAKVLEVQHQCSSTSGTNGFGNAASFGTEIYTCIEFWKEN